MYVIQGQGAGSCFTITHPTPMTRNKVSTIRELQDRSEELRKEGYIPVRPSRYVRGEAQRAFSWADYLHSQLMTQAGMTANNAMSESSARREVSTIFGVSGGENMNVPDQEGTPGLGFMDWGINNRLPNIVWLLSRLSPFVAAGIDFITKILVGHGPTPKYRYTQYIGGSITEKTIPFHSAGVLLRGQIADLKAKEEAEKDKAPLSPTLGSDGTLVINQDTDSEEMKQLKAQLAEWEATDAALRKFMEDNDLMSIFLSLAGDMALMSQCFVELQLNQRQLDEHGTPVSTANWTPSITGIKARSVFTTRLERMDENYRINNAYISNQWLDPTQSNSSSKKEDLKVSAVPFLSSTTPVKDLNRKIREARAQKVSVKKRPTRFILSPRGYGGTYYATALWHSIFAASIFEYAFTLIDDRLTRKRNSNIIGRVIYVHQDYINGLYRQLPKDSQKTQADILDEVFSEINTWLANPDNAGQALVSSMFTRDGKDCKAWEIVEIETKQKDRSEAEKTELQEISSIIFFAMGLDSKLIGNTPGDTSSSGGTDLRERFLVKQIQFAPLQQLMLQPLEVVSRFNGWDSHLVWEIDREVLTTLDNSKTGVTKQSSQ